MVVDVTDSEEGKDVVNERGDKIGIVSDVRHGTAYVEPDPGITDEIKAKLGWGDVDDDNYPLQEARIREITDDEIRLREL
ncbi:PRC-barrel domain containing protein [Halopelagius fulvigenes]|uniref:PRC-barrel domain containing protein n=1 Tax=Halopelagius fulvigenes TaxID=1198324 RepID=A0ABD5TV90_9EURY